MQIAFYQVDAFTKEAFRGNPAGVCVLEKEISERNMQLIAAEMNLSETAFVFPFEGAARLSSNRFKLRWFTPKTEVALCGHATLAVSKVLFDHLGAEWDTIFYETKSGKLTAQKSSEGILLDFPSDEPIGLNPPFEVLKTMGISHYETIFWGKNTNKLVIHLKTLADVLQLHPNFLRMKEVNCSKIKGVAVTCLGKDPYDFTSRYFNPWAGVDEDSVTGSVHTLLAPYWASLLKKDRLRAYQASQRGGEIVLRLVEQGRVQLIGESVVVLQGTIALPE